MRSFSDHCPDPENFFKVYFSMPLFRLYFPLIPVCFISFFQGRNFSSITNVLNHFSAFYFFMLFFQLKKSCQTCSFLFHFSCSMYVRHQFFTFFQHRKFCPTSTFYFSDFFFLICSKFSNIYSKLF